METEMLGMIGHYSRGIEGMRFFRRAEEGALHVLPGVSVLTCYSFRIPSKEDIFAGLSKRVLGEGEANSTPG